MVDMAAIAGLVTSLRAATDISKAMLGLRDAAMIQTKVIELQGIILSAQQSALSAQSDQFTALERIRELEKQLTDLEAWDTEKERYELKEVYPGAFARVLKPTAHAGEPPHWLCTACYKRGQKAILQDHGRSPEKIETIYQCPECKNSIRVHWGQNPDGFSVTTKATPGEVCPSCGDATYRVVNSAASATFGGLGSRTYKYACDRCGFEDLQMVTPGSRK